MSNQEKVLKKLGFVIEDLESETFNLDESLKTFFESQVDTFRGRKEFKEDIDKARIEGKIIATKDHKKLLKKRYGLDVSIEDAEQTMELIFDDLDKQILEKTTKSKDGESVEIEKLKGEISAWKEKLVLSNEEIIKSKEDKEIAVKNIENEFNTKISDREKEFFLNSDLSKDEYILNKDEALDIFKVRLSKQNLGVKVIDGKAVIVDLAGEKAINPANGTFFDYNEVKDLAIGNLKKQSNGGGVELGAITDTSKMSSEQMLMVEHLKKMQ